jgi:hypothetical protein
VLNGAAAADAEVFARGRDTVWRSRDDLDEICFLVAPPSTSRQNEHSLTRYGAGDEHAPATDICNSKPIVAQIADLGDDRGFRRCETSHSRHPETYGDDAL